jgi:hypothetical protein
MVHRLLAVCCAAATVVATLFTAQVSYLCSMTGHRQSHCCCAPKAAQANDVPASAIAAQCCERTIEVAQGPAATQPRDTGLAMAWAPGPLLAVVAAPSSRSSQRALPASLARGPPSGTAIYVRTCRFLI